MPPWHSHGQVSSSLIAPSQLQHALPFLEIIRSWIELAPVAEPRIIFVEFHSPESTSTRSNAPGDRQKVERARTCGIATGYFWRASWFRVNFNTFYCPGDCQIDSRQNLLLGSDPLSGSWAGIKLPRMRTCSIYCICCVCCECCTCSIRCICSICRPCCRFCVSHVACVCCRCSISRSRPSHRPIPNR